MAYADGSDLIKRYDWELVGDSATDDRDTLSRPEVLTHANVLSSLSGASGRINSALGYGAKFTPDDLEQLEGDDLEYLKDLVCDLAMVRLGQRRGENGLGGMIDGIRDNAEKLLELIRNGDNIFNLPQVLDASLVDTDGPTAIELVDRNDLTVRMGRYFPTPAHRLPLSQGGE